MREPSTSDLFSHRFAQAIRRRRDLDDSRMPPGPEGVPLLGSTVDMHKDVLGMFMRGLLEYGDTVRYKFGPFDFITIHRPEDIRTVLLERADEFPKSPSYDGLRMVIGDGLLNSEGSFWKRQRKLMTPAFHHKRLIGFGETMVRCSTELADDWDARARAEGGELEVDVHEQILALTLRIVGLTLFSTELSSRAGDVGPALGTVIEHANHVVTSMFLNPPNWVPTPRNVKFRKALAVVDELVLGIIGERRRAGPDQAEHGDLLAMLMAATDETGTERMTDAELRDEVATLVLAGHETTAQALTWTLMLLSQHPDVERRVVAEIREVCGDRPPSFADLKPLEYTGRVIDEAMRLYPPAWIFERQASVDVELGGYRIPAKSIVAISPWTLHRHPGIWANPEGFDPDRFLPERVAERPRYSYLPFGGGPRQCIGVNFALYEAKLVLATLVQRYSFALVPGQDLRPDASVTLRPAHGLQMRLTARSAGG